MVENGSLQIYLLDYNDRIQRANQITKGQCPELICNRHFRIYEKAYERFVFVIYYEYETDLISRWYWNDLNTVLIPPYDKTYCYCLFHVFSRWNAVDSNDGIDVVELHIHLTVATTCDGREVLSFRVETIWRCQYSQCHGCTEVCACIQI